ncbi:MAG: antiterminator LoaP [Treponema sp.]|jgi:transcriptional antiterminator NusG|nr:antiterminator LoaP [Treponema sp.]
MRYYALQVKTRSEEKYMKLVKSLHPEIDFPLYFPQRRLDIRRKGKIVHSTAAVFPGYIFAETGDGDPGTEDMQKYQWAFRRTEGFYRFLKSNQNITPLADKDLELVLHFIKKSGPVAGVSKVYFDENARIVVTEGPLMGLEGKIIKVDKRKGRAKIKLDLYDDSFSIDLAFEVMGPLEHR